MANQNEALRGLHELSHKTTSTTNVSLRIQGWSTALDTTVRWHHFWSSCLPCFRYRCREILHAPGWTNCFISPWTAERASSRLQPWLHCSSSEQRSQNDWSLMPMCCFKGTISTALVVHDKFELSLSHAINSPAIFHSRGYWVISATGKAKDHVKKWTFSTLPAILSDVCLTTTPTRGHKDTGHRHQPELQHASCWVLLSFSIRNFYRLYSFTGNLLTPSWLFGRSFLRTAVANYSQSCEQNGVYGAGNQPLSIWFNLLFLVVFFQRNLCSMLRLGSSNFILI
jgi:hypothetical protein